MMTTPQTKRGIVKQVLSGDSVIIRGFSGAPPPEKQLNFSSIVAPKLARRTTDPSDTNKDEPFAWEAREFLRKKLVGEEVQFTSEKPPNAMREYGVVYLGKDAASGENLTESLINEGLVSVRREGVRMTPDLQRLCELEDAARAAGRGKWAPNLSSANYIRDVKWSVENMRAFLDKHREKPIQAVIEHVRDGSTVRAFLLPEHWYITLMISGIRCPGFKLDDKGKPDPNAVVPFADEARFFVEVRLLQRDVQIILESVNNNNFVGSILFPKGNIAELLLKQGLARTVDWSMAFMSNPAEREKLKSAEKTAKESKLRIWAGYEANTGSSGGKTGVAGIKDKEFGGMVVEVINGDAIVVKTTSGVNRKVFLSSIRAPKEAARNDDDGKPVPRPKSFRALYDIPWMFEAREFLRKKLIDKKVQITIDYKQDARERLPERVCATVMVGGTNVAVALVEKGLAHVVRYRQDDDQRSMHYVDLLAAEAKAIKGLKGVHSKKEQATHRVNEIDATKSKSYLSGWQRQGFMDAIVEFVTSGSRLRLFVPKEHCLCTFLLGGISCPRGARPSPAPATNASNTPANQQNSEPFADEALAFTRDRCMQREVKINVVTTDKTGSFIGWLTLPDGTNLSVALVEQGLATVYGSGAAAAGGQSGPDYSKELKTAEDKARNARLRLWKGYVEVEKVADAEGEGEDEAKTEGAKGDQEVKFERKVNYEEVVVTEVTDEGTFFAQSFQNGPKAEQLLSQLRQEFEANPPLPGAYTPKRGDLCAAQYSVDNDWYRAKVTKIQGSNVTVVYIDYGNTETIPSTRLAPLPSTAYTSPPPYAREYRMACAKLPNDADYAAQAIKYLRDDCAAAGKLLLNVEYPGGSGEPAGASLATGKGGEGDLVKGLIGDGLLLVEKGFRRNRNVQALIAEYTAAQEVANKKHLCIWEYGDITDDDAKEFGI